MKRNQQKIIDRIQFYLRSPLVCILAAVLTVSPNRQYRGAFRPTTPATHGPEGENRLYYPPEVRKGEYWGLLEVVTLPSCQNMKMLNHNQVRDMTAFSIHFFIVHHIKITIHLPYCYHKLVYNNNTKINYTLEDYVIFL